MKFFSFDYLISEASEGLKRFPAALGIAMIGTFILMFAVDLNHDNEELLKVVLAAWIAFPFQLACNLAFPDKKWAHFPGFIVWILTYFLIGDFSQETNAIRIFILGLFTHLCVSVAPYLNKNTKTIDFWYFNLLIFQRIILSAAFSFIIALGLTLAFVSLDALFNIDIDNKIYPKIWILSFGLFNTWMFLGGIPKFFNFDIKDNDYPRHFELLTKFVLLPLVLIYLAILYAYIMKIGIQMELPRGWVSWLFLIYSIAGIFTFLLVWPLADEENQNWIQNYARYFYLALIPLLLVEYIAIGTRIAQYGFTENRFFVLILSLWLNALVVYFAFLKRKNIRVIPMSLAVVALLNVAVPWSAFSVSYRSQMNRLIGFLTEANILKDGKIQEVKIQSDSLQREINNLVNYLGKNHNLDEVIALLPKEKQDSIQTQLADGRQNKWALISEIQEQLGTHDKIQNPDLKNIYFTIDERDVPALSVKGFDEVLAFSIHDYNSNPDTRFFLDADSLNISYFLENKQFKIDLTKNFEQWVNRYQDSLAKQKSLNSHESNYNLSQNLEWSAKDREISGQQIGHQYTLYILSANIEKSYTRNVDQQGLRKRIDNVRGLLMIRKN